MTQFIKILISSLIILNICSCTVKMKKHGYVFDESSVKKLQVGKTTKAAVIEIMGSPSTISDFDKNNWYYISNDTKQISMLKPKSVADKVMQITFKNNKVKQIKVYKSSDIKKLAFVKDKTESLGVTQGC